MKVKDIDGKVIEGLERGYNNSLVVTDKVSYNKYIAELEKTKKIKKLEEEMLEIKDSLSEILTLLKRDR